MHIILDEAGYYFNLVKKNTSMKPITLDQLGYTKEQLDQIHAMMDGEAGIFLVAGQTGSGKTVTVSAIIKEIAKKVEGPVPVMEKVSEHKIPGATIISSDNMVDAAYQAMRLDPDVVLIGELRDKESCDLAVRLAKSGIRVWSTIHAGAPGQIEKSLERLGMNQEDLDLVRGTIWQELIPTMRMSAHVSSQFKSRASMHTYGLEVGG